MTAYFSAKLGHRPARDSRARPDFDRARSHRSCVLPSWAAGVSGLTCAHLLRGGHDVTVFEADDRPGGHANSVTVRLGEDEHRVDTGFIVYNERNYPVFSRLLGELGVSSRPSDMSFSVSDETPGIEWCTSSPATAFAQPRNLARSTFLRMLADIVRFNRAMLRLLDVPVDPDFTLAEFLAHGRWSSGFVDWYLVPMGSAIWSADPATFTRFPAAAFARFFDNHGLLRLGEQPHWRTVVGGSASYVEAMARTLGRQLRLSTAVSKVVRRHGGIELATDIDAWSNSTTSSLPPIPTRPYACCRTRRRPSDKSSVPSDIGQMSRPSTPTDASCRAGSGPGPAGTGTANPARTPRHSPMTWAACKACRHLRLSVSRSIGPTSSTPTT